MQLSCPNCGATYQVPDNAIGPNGRKIRCRACQTSWFEAGQAASPAPPPMTPPPVSPIPGSTSVPESPDAASGAAAEKPPRRRRGPWLLLGLVILAVILGG